MTDLTETERRLVWVFGSPRSGSTWLMALLGAGGGVRMINEPGIGVHLGTMLNGFLPIEPSDKPAVHRLDQFRREDENYFFSAESEQVWRPALRSLMLERFSAQLAGHTWAVVKEPHGSQAADIVMSALPRSRMIFLLRDGRDVIDSMLDAVAADGWLLGLLDGFRSAERAAAIRSQAHMWLWRTEAVQRAFEAHPSELRMIVRYEDLRRDPVPILQELAGWLDLESEPMTELVQRTAADRSQKGPGKFIRAAEPGLWRANFSTAEQAAIEAVLGEKLRELGYAPS
jgi:Sulfotransferase family